MTRLRRVLLIATACVVAALLAIGASVYAMCIRYDASMARVYDLPVPSLTHSSDPAVVERGKHLVGAIGMCGAAPCHGSDLGGGDVLDYGVGVVAGPNVTPAGVAGAYSDGELVRLIQHGVKRDGHSVQLMPAQAFGWLPDADALAIVSYVRSVPPVARANRPTEIRTPLKVVDRLYDVPIDVARRVEPPPDGDRSPQPTAAYGALLARLCAGCHGARLSGGRISGLPPSMVTPLNLTPDATGLKDWGFEDFDRALNSGVRKNGSAIIDVALMHPWNGFDVTETQALWAYLSSLSPLAFGGR